MKRQPKEDHWYIKIADFLQETRTVSLEMGDGSWKRIQEVIAYLMLNDLPERIKFDAFDYYLEKVGNNLFHAIFYLRQKGIDVYWGPLSPKNKNIYVISLDEKYKDMDLERITEKARRRIKGALLEVKRKYPAELPGSQLKLIQATALKTGTED